MSIIATGPSTLEVDRTDNLKRKANEAVDALRMLSAKQPKRSKPKIYKFQAEYKENLKTFKVSLWATNAITPKEMAQRGWKAVCREPEKRKSCIECCSCGNKMSTEVPDPKLHDDKLNLKFLKNVRRDLSEKHSLTCVYRSVKVTFQDLCYDNTLLEDSLEILTESYRTKLHWEPIYKDFITLTGEIHDFMKENGYDKNAIHGLSQTEILAALLWEGKETEWGTSSLYCSLCNRDCMLIQYMEDFDPLISHRCYCPIFDSICDEKLLWQERIRYILGGTKPQEPVPPTNPAPSSFALRISKLLGLGISSVVKSQKK